MEVNGGGRTYFGSGGASAERRGAEDGGGVGWEGRKGSMASENREGTIP
jgi:hypothetical protein